MPHANGFYVLNDGPTKSHLHIACFLKKMVHSYKKLSTRLQGRVCNNKAPLTSPS